MSALKPLFAAFAVSFLASACTLHVGSDPGDASFWDDDEEDSGTYTPPPATTAPADVDAEPDEPETDAGETPNETPDAEATADATAPVDTTPEPSASMSEVDSGTVPSATPSASATSQLPPSSYLCEAPEEMDECDRCLEHNCQMERAACCGADCEDTWPQVQACMAMIEDAGDPVQAWYDLDACIDMASNSGSIDMDEQFNSVLNCVNAPYTGSLDNDPFSHQEGDGTCTLACYGVPYMSQD